MSHAAECMKCRSTRLIPLVGILDQGQYSDGSLKAIVAYTNPDAWVFKGAIHARLKATICGDCGHTELTAEGPAALYAAYTRHKSQST